MTRQLVVGALVVDDLETPSLLLAARRTAPRELAGLWELPGGKVEPDEEPRDALRRELREELSVEVVLGRELVGPRGGSWPISDRFVMRLWFATVSGAGPTAGTSHDEVRWLAAAQWDDVYWLPADRSVVAHLRQELVHRQGR